MLSRSDPGGLTTGRGTKGLTSGLPRFTRVELLAIILIGVLTPLIDERVERFLLPFLSNLQDSLRVYQYTGGPLLGDVLIVWLQYGAVLTGYLVRKPGAATIAMTINGFVQVFVNGTHAPHLLYGVTGLGADFVFGYFRYARYNVARVMLAGVASQVFWYPIVYFTHGVFLYPLFFVVSDFVLRVVGSAFGNGLLGAAFGFITLTLARRAGVIFGSQVFGLPVKGKREQSSAWGFGDTVRAAPRN